MYRDFRVETTLNQFLSIRGYLDCFDVIDEITKNPKFQNLRVRSNVNVDDIKVWLFNGWNTERVLGVSHQLFDSSDNHFVLQWSFPQSYYSVFQITQSFIYLIRDTKLSHKSIMDKFGELVETKWYPETISFYCDGTMKNPILKNIKQGVRKLRFEEFSSKSKETEISSLLKSTRKLILSEERNQKYIQKKYTTGKGKNRKNKERLNENEWKEISERIGVTTLLHFLYRKRIKSNYKDIDTFTSGHNSSRIIHECLMDIVYKLNLINESYIYKVIGDDKYSEIYDEFTKGRKIPYLKKRFNLIKERVN